VNYINAHATSTLAGDLAEVNAVKQVFKDSSEIKMNGTKVSFLNLAVKPCQFLFAFNIFLVFFFKFIMCSISVYEAFFFSFPYVVYDRALSRGSRRIGGNCNYQSNKYWLVASHYQPICKLLCIICS
jgi:Beta-ketoacyl synthase, C-terminal domain